MVGDSRDIPGHDLLLLRFVSEVDDGAADQHLREWDRRAIRRYVGKGAAPTWEGLTWILDLLPNEPNDALAVLSNYISVHAQELPDIRLAGLSDAMSIIRNRYLHIDTRTELDLVDLLLSLHWRDFEYFVAAVWAAQGYRVQVTPRSKDRGKDVIATRDGVNAELVFIECKNWRGVVPVGPVRELRGAVTKADANRGVLVATSGFTEGDASATEEADGDNRLTLVDGPELVRLAHTHLGANWARNLDRIVMDMRANTNATRKKE